MQHQKLPKKIKKMLSKISSVADPIIIIAIMLFFIVPALTVINLTPKIDTSNNNTQVLGTTDNKNVDLSFNEVKANNIYIEKVSQNSEKSYTAYISFDQVNSGEYINNLLDAENKTSDQKKIQIAPVFNGTPNDCKISVEVGGVRKVLLDNNGEIYPISIYVMPNEILNTKLIINPQNDLNYSNQFGLDISVE